tara:strand:- start:4924 stop:5604 length:681 start_codon:yes stop_codon:yes gene_type:complete
MNFAFYVSGKATRLVKTLTHLEHSNAELLKKIKLAFIDNCDNDSLRELCGRLGLNFFEFDADAVEKELINETLSGKLLECCLNEKIDYGFVFGRRILVGEILNKYNHRLINFHPSLLPLFKGVNAIDQALKEKAFLLGNSAHFINEKVDEGEIIMQSLLPSLSFNNYDDVLDMQIYMLIQIMRWLIESRITVKKGRVNINNAKYEISSYIPNLEFTINEFFKRENQ